MQTQRIAGAADLWFAWTTSAAIGVFDLAQRRLYAGIAGRFLCVFLCPVGPAAGADGHKSRREKES